ncbi:MAG TPA: alkaline phosphatase family protein, partial [Candidatus Binataceae bacterium]|nr:alkaline phosphatase family protein [Candidatus Binataceae bacterium]
MNRSIGLRALAAIAAGLALGVASCNVVTKIMSTGGEQTLKPPVVARVPGPRMIIFALDGAGYNQFMAAVHSGKAPNIAGVLGAETSGGLFAHAYSAPHALTMLPSSTIADWTAVMTGDPPAWDGVTGDEWFERDKREFFAPVPISIGETGDLDDAIVNDLVGKAIEVPTLYELLGVDTNVSLLLVYRGATLYTTVEPSAFTGLMAQLIEGKMVGESAEKSLSASIDLASVRTLISAIEQHGVPDLQVVYFPGVDSFTHTSRNPLEAQTEFIERVSDAGVGQVLDEYRKKGALDGTYIMFIADHGHTPTIDDHAHALGAEGSGTPFAVVNDVGFRVRKAKLALTDSEQDYQAVLAYQGFMAYIYLADRTTCASRGERCDWSRPPNFEEDVMPVVRAFYKVNRTGRPYPRLKGTIDLIFARMPVAHGAAAVPFEIYDGRRLVPIRDYLARHPRPDLIELDRRMRWLGAGPYGNRAGDIVLLARTGADVPIERRYYFAVTPHYSWHGSAGELDSHIPFILAQEGGKGEKMRAIVRKATGGAIYEKDLTPVVRAVFG